MRLVLLLGQFLVCEGASATNGRSDMSFISLRTDRLMVQQVETSVSPTQKSLSIVGRLTFPKKYSTSWERLERLKRRVTRSILRRTLPLYWMFDPLAPT